MSRCRKSYGSRISFESAGAGLSSFPLFVLSSHFCVHSFVRSFVGPSVRSSGPLDRSIGRSVGRSIDRSIEEFHSFNRHVRAARTFFPADHETRFPLDVSTCISPIVVAVTVLA